jgi:tripartite-type tricarboxylate transporter receptor subunit TctC
VEEAMMTRGGAFLLALCVLGVEVTQAQTFPARPVTVIVTSAAGGVTDIVARGVSQRLSEIWGQRVIIENRAGGGHNIGAAAVAKAPPDGLTLMVTEAGTFVTNPHLYPKGKLPYDADKDFAPVSGLVRNNPTLLAHPSLPVRNLRELVALARKKPGEITYGTAGIGTAPHMALVSLELMEGVKFAPVHYRGVAPALNDVLGGHTLMVSTSVTLAQAPAKAGRVNIIAIGRRVPELPDAPTSADGGVPAYDSTTWFGLFAPAETPPAIVNKINSDVQRVLADPLFRQKFLGPQFLEPVVGSPSQFGDFIRSEEQRWGKIIRDAKITIGN